MREDWRVPVVYVGSGEERKYEWAAERRAMLSVEGSKENGGVEQYDLLRPFLWLSTCSKTLKFRGPLDHRGNK